jgi:microcystin-dependent protein
MTATIPVDNDQPSIVLDQIVVEGGLFPQHNGDPTSDTGGIPLGAIRTFANVSAAQSDTAGREQLAIGESLQISQQPALFSLLGTNYGGNGFANFGLPNLAGTVMVGAGNGPSGQVFQGETYGQHSVTLTGANLPTVIGGGGQPITNDQPSQAVTYLINVAGSFGSNFDSVDVAGMVVPFLGNFAPDGYMVAAGQLLSIAEYPILFAQLGNIYGGNASQGTFALPDLQGRIIVGASDPGLGISGTQSLGERAGSGTPIDNHQPSVALTYLICTSGIFFSPGRRLGAQHPLSRRDHRLCRGRQYSQRLDCCRWPDSLHHLEHGAFCLHWHHLRRQWSNHVPTAESGRPRCGWKRNGRGPSRLDNDGMTFGTSNITLTGAEIPANQAPAITITAPSYSVPEFGTLQLLGTGISLADPGGGSGSETLTITPSHGTFTFISPSSNGTVVSLNSNGGITVSGSIAQLNAWLSQTNLASAELGYVNADHQPGTETLDFTLNERQHRLSCPGRHRLRHHRHRALLFPRHADPDRARTKARRAAQDRRQGGDKVWRGGAGQMDRTAELFRSFRPRPQGYSAGLHQGRRAR